MSLPFTREQFFQVLSTYNDDVMPLQIGLVLLGLSAFGAMVVRRRDSDRVISAILAGLWAWMGIVYHLMYFREINPALGLLVAGLAGVWLVFDPPAKARHA